MKKFLTLVLICAVFTPYRYLYSAALTYDVAYQMGYLDREDTLALIKAAQEGNQELCKQLIERGVPVNISDSEKRTPLMGAAQQGHKKVCQLLIEKGANVNACSKYGITPLMESAHAGHIDICRALLECGALRDVENSSGETAYMIASRAGHTAIGNLFKSCRALLRAVTKGNSELVKALLDDGIPPNVKNDEGMTGLHIAAKKGYLESVQYFVKAGAYKDLKDDTDQSPLMYAVKHDHVDCLEALLAAGAACNVVDQFGFSPLFVASLSGHEACVRALINAGAHVNDGGGITGSFPLLAALEGKHVSSVEALLQGGALVARSFKGLTPLHIAAMYGPVANIELLLRWRADKEAKDGEGNTPLLTACYWAREGCVEALLLQGARVDVCNRFGMNCLHLAAMTGKGSLLRELIRFGVELKSVDLYGFTPLDRALASGNGQSIQLLLEAGAPMTGKKLDDSVVAELRTQLSQALTSSSLVSAVHELIRKGARALPEDFTMPIRNNDRQCARALLMSGINLEAIIDRMGNTLLHEAAGRGSQVVVNELLSAGAQPNVRNTLNQTPLHKAAQGGHNLTVKVLLEGGARIDLRDREERTPLHRAVLAGDQNSITALVKAGALIDALDNGSMTPLQLAVFNKSINHRIACIEALVREGADLSRKANDGETLLARAIKDREAPLVKLYMKRGAARSSVEKIFPELSEVLGMTPLHWAVVQGDDVRLNNLLLNGASVVAQNSFGDTPLHWAALGGHLPAIEQLISAGARINSRNNDGATPLCCAVMQDEVDAVFALIKAGADLTIRDNLGRIPLHYAALMGYLECTEALVEKGANGSAQDKDGKTAQELVEEKMSTYSGCALLPQQIRERTELSKSLAALKRNWVSQASLSRGLANQEIQNSTGAPVSIPRSRTSSLLDSMPISFPGSGFGPVGGQSGRVGQLKGFSFGGAMMSFPQAQDQTPLHLAAGEGNLERLNELIARGSARDLSALDSHKQMPLHCAIKRKHTACAETLIKAGAPLEEGCDEYNNGVLLTPLMLAAQANNRELCQLLIRHKANVNAQGIVLQGKVLCPQTGYTALMIAARSGYSSICEILIEHGAKIDLQNEDGATALMLAAGNGHLEVCNLLVEKGADILQKDDGQLIAENYAEMGKDEGSSYRCREGQAGCYELLKGKRTQGTGAQKKVESTIATPAAAPLKPRNTLGYSPGATPLHCAAIDGDLERMAALIKGGAWLDERDNHGMTPLLLTAKYGHVTCFELLIASGAQVLDLDNQLMSVLHWAAKNGFRALVEKVAHRKELLELRDSTHRSAVDWAILHGYEDIVRTLVQSGAKV